jgi:hypothetical protein
MRADGGTHPAFSVHFLCDEVWRRKVLTGVARFARQF